MQDTPHGGQEFSSYTERSSSFSLLLSLSLTFLSLRSLLPFARSELHFGGGGLYLSFHFCVAFTAKPSAENGSREARKNGLLDRLEG